MCGRFCLTTPLATLAPRLGAPLPPGLAHHYAPRIQVRPGEPLLALRQEHGRDEVALMLWGLLPDWVKDPAGANRSINARAETVDQKPSFRGAWRHRRCLLPADGFYEWSGAGAGRRPWLIRRQGGAPFWLGGSGSAGSALMAASWRAAACSPPPRTPCWRPFTSGCR